MTRLHPKLVERSMRMPVLTGLCRAPSLDLWQLSAASHDWVPPSLASDPAHIYPPTHTHVHTHSQTTITTTTTTTFYQLWLNPPSPRPWSESQGLPTAVSPWPQCRGQMKVLVFCSSSFWGEMGGVCGQMEEMLWDEISALFKKG